MIDFCDIACFSAVLSCYSFQSHVVMVIICNIVRQFSVLWPWLALINVGCEYMQTQKAVGRLMDRREGTRISPCRWKRKHGLLGIHSSISNKSMSEYMNSINDFSNLFKNMYIHFGAEPLTSLPPASSPAAVKHQETVLE